MKIIRDTQRKKYIRLETLDMIVSLLEISFNCDLGNIIKTEVNLSQTYATIADFGCSV